MLPEGEKSVVFEVDKRVTQGFSLQVLLSELF